MERARLALMASHGRNALEEAPFTEPVPPRPIMFYHMKRYEMGTRPLNEDF